MARLPLPTISPAEFMRRIGKRPYENAETIRGIESILVRERGYVFKMPKAGSPVILLVSGGLDSIVTWSLLMERYRLRVYPLFLYSNDRRKLKQLEAVDYFSRLYQKRYPDLYVDPKKTVVVLPSPIMDMDPNNLTAYFHPSNVLGNLKSGSVSEIFSQASTPFIYPFTAIPYAAYLWNRHRIRVRTVFSGIATGDGAVVTSQTFTSLRTTLLGFCASTADYSWQFASLAFEKELGHWIDKSTYIRLAETMRIPLERTWTCYHSGLFQCGNSCVACKYRRNEFGVSGVADRTLYRSDMGRKDYVALGLRRILTGY